MAKGGFLQLLKSQFANPKPNSILYNRVLLYLMVFIALVQLYSYGISGQFTFLFVFVLIGFLTTFFSKNMIVVLVISVVFTAVVQAGMSNGRYEGMEGKDDKAGDAAKPKTDDVKSESGNAGESNKAETKPSAPAAEGEVAKKDAASDENTKKEKAEKTLEGLYVDGKELEEVQKQIIQGFSTIDPYMQKAQSLVENMEAKANTLSKLGYSNVK